MANTYSFTVCQTLNGFFSFLFFRASPKKESRIKPVIGYKRNNCYLDFLIYTPEVSGNCLRSHAAAARSR